MDQAAIQILSPRFNTMELDGKRVLVTGGAGFIGSNVVRELLASDVAEVVIYDNLARGKLEYLESQFQDVRCSMYPHGGDIRNPDLLADAMRGADAVVHLAAMWLLHCKDFPRTAFAVNIEGSFNVLEACVATGVERLVYASSASVYGDAIEVPMTEEHPLGNRNFYGATKIAGEAMCRAFSDRYGLNFVGLRFMNVYGPNQDQDAAYAGVIPTMLNMIDDGKAPTVNGDGSQAYDFINVSDAALCTRLAIESEHTDSFYNVGTGVQTSIRELCGLILELRASDLEVQYVPYSADDARQFVQNRVADVSKARTELGFTFRHDLQTGLNQLIDWRSTRDSC
jgi:UDP-glucose 4-epimerase